MRRILASPLVVTILALGVCAFPAPARATLDTLLITPHMYIVPPNPTANDSVRLELTYCDPCAQLVSIESLNPVIVNVRLDHHEPASGDSCPNHCPWPITGLTLGTYSVGTHLIIVDTYANVISPDSSISTVHSRVAAYFDVTESPPPPDSLPFVKSITIGAVRPCGIDPVVCPFDSIPVRIAGTFPSNCYTLRRIDLLPSLSMSPRPQPPTVRILVDDMACLGRPCLIGEFPWSARVLLPGLPPGDYPLRFELAKVSCSDSFPSDSSVHFASVPFTVADSCPPTTAARCVAPGWDHPDPATHCDGVVSRQHPALLTFIVRPTVALSGLQGQFSLFDLAVLQKGAARPAATQPPFGPALEITAIEPIGVAAGMHLQWSPVQGGARFVMFADAGAPIPPAPFGPDSLSASPILRITVSEPDSGLVASTSWLGAFDLLGADSNGVGVPECDLQCMRRDLFATICTERHDCDVNHDGTQDVRDLVTMVHCIMQTGPCPDSSAAAFDCNGDGKSTLDDVLCCGGVILRGHLPDSTLRRPEPGISAAFGDPVSTENGVDVPLTLADEWSIGAARLALAFPTDRFDVTGVSLEGFHFGFLLLHERDGDQLLIGAIQTYGVRPAVVTDGKLHLMIHFALKPGAEPAGMVTLTSGDFSGPDGAALAVDLGQPSQMLGGGPVGLSAVQPNPFGREARFGVRLTRPAQVELEVHDLVGRRVTTLYRGSLAAGVRVFTWDGRDSNGSRAANGVYFVRLRTDGRVTARKVVLVREP